MVYLPICNRYLKFYRKLRIKLLYNQRNKALTLIILILALHLRSIQLFNIPRQGKQMNLARHYQTFGKALSSARLCSVAFGSVWFEFSWIQLVTQPVTQSGSAVALGPRVAHMRTC